VGAGFEWIVFRIDATPPMGIDFPLDCWLRWASERRTCPATGGYGGTSFGYVAPSASEAGTRT
jgi:hypothetical protein